MATVTTRDGAEIFYKDWGSGTPVVFSHGWPLNADIWDDQLLFLAQRGFRAIAHDRRGHGRSSQTSHGNDMNSYADDLATLMDDLQLEGAVLVGHSTGGGEVTRYIGRHGTERLAGVVLIGAIPPQALKTPTNPHGAPMEAFEQIRAGLLRDRSDYYKELSAPFYGANRPGAQVSDGVREQFWRLSMQAGLKGIVECTRTWEQDYAPDLARIDVPLLIVHGDDDQIVPIAATGLRTKQLLPHATLKVYQGAPHGLTATHKDRFHADLLEFLHSVARVAPGVPAREQEASPPGVA
jgi:non-heme chloroperoxidase